MYHQVANGRGRHVEPQGVPVLAVVEADEYRQFGGREQQPLAHRVLAHRVHGTIGQAAHRLLPGRAAIMRTPDVRLQVVHAQAVHRGVHSIVVEV